MPTIKIKKEMNLPELIEWGWKNIEQVRGKVFNSHVKDMFGDYSTVQFSVDGYGFKTDRVSYNATFTVEVDEEITEDTEFKYLMEVDRLPHQKNRVWYDISIAEAKYEHSKEFYTYINEELELIWHDGKLVE